MNKKGFTLVEIVVVIAIIGLVMILILPNITESFKKSLNKTMKMEEKEMKDAALMYLEDYCKNPIGYNRCPASRGLAFISRNSDNTFTGYIKLSVLTGSTLTDEAYIDKVTYKEKECDGYVIITNNEAKAYLNCEGAYTTTGYDESVLN